MDNIQSGINTLVAASLSENTKVVYRGVLTKFKSFRKVYKLGEIWPVPENHIMLFVSFCFKKGYSAASVITYVSALSYFHKLHAYADPTEFFVLKKMLEGFRRLKGRKDVRAPITLDILSRIVGALPSICFDSYETALFRAAFCITYFCLLRVGEVVYTDTKQAGYALGLDDIEFLKGGHELVVRIRKSKGDQRGRTSFIRVKAQVNKSVCPVLLIASFLSLRSRKPGVLFVHMNSKPLTRSQFSGVLAKTISYLGLHHAQFRSHSFRIGRATNLAMEGVPNTKIQEMGRWKSGAFRSYIRC